MRKVWARTTGQRSWWQAFPLRFQRQVSPTATGQMGRTKNGFKISSAQIITRIRLGS